MAPLRQRWSEVREAANGAMEQAELYGATPETVRDRLRGQVAPFLDEIATIQVLDPACGSGNFLYVALALLKALEKEAIAFAELYGADFRRASIRASFTASRSIRTRTRWRASSSGSATSSGSTGTVGPAWRKPILRKLHQIELKDALVDDSDPAQPKEATWPKADVIVGNPPFLGGKLLRRGLGDEDVKRMFAVYNGRCGARATFAATGSRRRAHRSQMARPIAPGCSRRRASAAARTRTFFGG